MFTSDKYVVLEVTYSIIRTSLIPAVPPNARVGKDLVQDEVNTLTCVHILR